MHRDRSTATTARLRGWVLAAFADVGLPAGARPFVLEELATSREPHLVAAAARATRGASHPDDDLADALVDALERTHERDDTVTFEALAPTWPTRSPTTATTELLDALLAMEPTPPTALPGLRAVLTRHGRPSPARHHIARAIRDLEARQPATPHCCSPAPEPPENADDSADAVFARSVDLSLGLEDQHGAKLTVGDLLREPLTLVAFFYTRCPNPEKCSATITKLARIESILGPGIGIAAVTYDPGYDTAPRLRAYGEARGIQFGPSTRLVRCPHDHDDLARTFGLRVGYNGSVVNRHAIELHLVAADGRIIETWARIPWDPTTVAATARRYLTPEDHTATTT